MSEPKRYEWTSNMGMIEFSGGAYVTASDYYSMRGSLRKDVAKSGVNARKNIHPLLTEKNEQIAALKDSNELLKARINSAISLAADCKGDMHYAESACAEISKFEKEVGHDQN